jgi:hypothetical protein
MLITGCAEPHLGCPCGPKLEPMQALYRAGEALASRDLKMACRVMRLVRR